MLYGCETLSLTLREECRLRVFAKRILRLIFGPKMDGNGRWARLHNEELHSLHSFQFFTNTKNGLSIFESEHVFPLGNMQGIISYISLLI